MESTKQSSSQLKKDIAKTLELLKSEKVDATETLGLAKALKQERAFGYARKLLSHAIDHPSTVIEQPLKKTLGQQLALCTYKDQDLPPALSLDQAFDILDQSDPLESSEDQETLGIAGAIYKRKWIHGNQKQYLERALIFYQRGYQLGPKVGWHTDQGYNAINAAFVLDLLGSLELKEARKAKGSSTGAEYRFSEAEKIRKDLLKELPPLLDEKEHAWMKDKWWVLVTIGEAHFGLGQYQQALKWLKQADTLPDVPDWERESTARQLASLLRLRTERSDKFSTERPEAEQVLREFLGNDSAVLSVLTGKIGLALSGGGFRASLYHIGVLARLAELDLLRQVEVISCVSGGSIIGAHYYLEVRHLLQTKNEQDISPNDYIEIVKRIEKNFLAGVQTNIRTRLVTDLEADVKMVVSPHYSRTNRLGELYEQQLYSSVQDGEENEPRYLNKLKIKPKDEPTNFAPKDHNWKRSVKVPILTLNATSLNTGHNWQFTASWMGEPPAGIDTEIDANYRLRRMYYKEDAPDKFKNIRLGDAVAASSCVPGLFEPLAMAELYPEITVRLVDGGVYDNQGTAGLLDQNCEVMLVSDASGQMSTEDQPGSGFVEVPLRTNSILQTRVRSAQYHELDARLKAGLLQNLMYIHLKKDLQGQPKNWIKGQKKATGKATTDYGINKTYQEALANLRTDLDSFTNNEAYGLMLSGYKMTEHYCPSGLTASAQPLKESWNFLRKEQQLTQPTIDEDLLNQLKVGAQNFFKVWRLSRPLQVILTIILAVVVFTLLAWLPANWGTILFKITAGGLAALILVFVINRLGGGFILKTINYKKTLREIGIGILALLAGWNIAQLHLRVFDRIFLWIGRK